MYRGHDGLRVSAHGHEQIAQHGRVGQAGFGAHFGNALQLGQVRSRAEVCAGPAQQDHSDVIVGSRAMERLGQRRHQLAVEGVALLGPVHQ